MFLAGNTQDCDNSCVLIWETIIAKVSLSIYVNLECEQYEQFPPYIIAMKAIIKRHHFPYAGFLDSIQSHLIFNVKVQLAFTILCYT